jgi:hypothetical protein
MKAKRIAAVGSILAVCASMIALSFNPASAAGARTLRGVIGGDFHGILSVGGDDWGALASLNRGAATRINDADVAVVDDQAPAGVTSEDESDHACTGTFQVPTAPPDKVCIYISNGDNAVDVHGVSIVPGSTGGSRYGFKMVWSTPTDDADTFVEASWAYRLPAS